MTVEHNTAEFQEYKVIRPWQLTPESKLKITNKDGKVFDFSGNKQGYFIFLDGGHYILNGYPYGGVRVGQALHLFHGVRENTIVIETIQKISALGILEDTFTPYIKQLADEITALKEFESVIAPIRERLRLQPYTAFENEHAKMRFQVDEVIYALCKSLEYRNKLSLSSDQIIEYLKFFAKYIDGTARFHRDKVMKKSIEGETSTTHFEVSLCYFPNGDVSHVYVYEEKKFVQQLKDIYAWLRQKLSFA